MSGPTKLEITALGMLHRLSNATDGQPQWRALDLIVHTAEDINALKLAVKHGWIDLTPDARSVCLTEKGCRIAKPR